MADINCSHCNEPWDVYGLRTDSIGYLDPGDGDDLAPLGPVATVLGYLSRNGGESDRVLRPVLARLANDALGGDLSLPALFTWWWDSDTDTVEAKAAKRVVDTAIYLGVMHGKGCTECGFDHDDPGPHREVSLSRIVFGGVTDDDPAEYLG